MLLNAIFQEEEAYVKYAIYLVIRLHDILLIMKTLLFKLQNSGVRGSYIVGFETT